MLCVLGEGRGHMTQAMAVKEMVERAGHQVVKVALGLGSSRPVPPFFESGMKIPIERMPTLDFSFKNNRGVSLPATLAGVPRRFPAYRQAIAKMKEMVRDGQPDVILNFFEGLTAYYAATCHHRPPIVAIGHQFMFGHPDYVRAPGLRMQQLGLKWYVRFVGAASTRLALSLYEAPDLPRKKITVCPPLLRGRLFELTPNPNGKFVLAYLLNHGYAGQIIEWHRRNPKTALHCFYDKPNAPVEDRIDDTLTFHRLDGEKFLRMMADCRAVACTAGFESLCEAAYLGKPVFMVPVENHVEQQVNALDATRIGLGVTDASFNLDRLADLPDKVDRTRFQSWFARAETILLQTIERAVSEARENKSQPRAGVRSSKTA